MRKPGFLLVAIGLFLTVWNGYCYWQGFRPVKPLEERTHAISPPPKLGERIGTLFIPKLHTSLPIYHGASENELRKGVGHYPKSAMPGQPNNVVLSGHRDTVFRKLGQVGVGDQLVVETKLGRFVYDVKKVRIVSENDRTVIVEKPRPTLTVTTCYPFHWIGDAKQRYVLVAQLASVQR